MTSLLLELIDKLKPGELKDAAAWLACPVHNQKQEVADLFAHLKEMKELSIVPKPETAYVAAVQKPAFTPARWSKLQHLLLSSLEDFLAYQYFRSSTYDNRLALLNAYQEKDLERHQQTRLNRYRAEKAREVQAAGSDRFWYEYYLEIRHYDLVAANQRQIKSTPLKKEEYLQKAVLAQQLRQACESLAYLRLFTSTDEIPLLSENLQAAEAYKHEPGIRLFQLAALLYRETDQGLDQVFTDLKNGLEQHIALFPVQDQRNLLVLAINHCLRQSNAGRDDYYRESLDLYQLGIREKILYKRGELGIFTFNNIIAIALRQGETEWAADFLEDNARRLPEEHRHEVESLNRARLAFHKKDYDATLSFLQTSDYRDFIHHMSARVMQLKIFYERDNYNLLASHIRATRSLLRRRRNIGYHQRNYQNIFSLADKLVKLPPRDQEVRDKLRKIVMETEPCTEREWMIKRLEG